MSIVDGGRVMQALFVNFNVPGKSVEDVSSCWNRSSPRFSELPGLLAKIWLANGDDDRYGALYLWRDQEALDSFLASDLWKSVGSHPSLANFDVRPFAVVEDFTKATQPGLVIV
jgi:heme-degrading monooxygenase HmoA